VPAPVPFKGRVMHMPQRQLRSLDDVDTLGDLARLQAAVRPAADALLFEGRSTSYGDFDRYASRVANGLRAAGLRPGARVGYLGKNSDLFFQVVFGCAKAGIVLVGVNWRLAPPEVSYILNDARVEVLFVAHEFRELAAKVLPEVPSLRLLVAVEEGHPGWPDFVRWRDQHPDDDPAVPVATGDVAVQMYTSGTTGHPKGVLLAHRSFFAMLREPPAEDMEFERWTEHDVSLVAMPNYHIGGVGWGIAGLRAGARNIVLKEFDAAQVLAAIQQHRISKLFLVPTAMRLVLQLPGARRTDYDSLRYISYGASPIPLDLLREAIEVFQCGFVQLYGMTETTGGATYLPPQDHDVRGNERMRSAGKPFPGVSIKVVDVDGTPLPPRVMGEICIRSPANMVGYWNLPEVTARTLVDGWVHTGDAGYLDEDGYVYVLDRARDLILSGGENISPAEVESAIFGHPAVADVAVIGVPDERWGEAVKAMVVLKPGVEATAAEIIAYARERIAGYKLPKSVDFIAELPRNPSGKVLKRELRKPYWAGLDRRI
jgi:acyl-CoA synthetase (AMP-forming)/AMP-acid ligase II